MRISKVKVVFMHSACEIIPIEPGNDLPTGIAKESIELGEPATTNGFFGPGTFEKPCAIFPTRISSAKCIKKSGS